MHIFSSTHGAFINMDYILSHKQNFSEFKRLKITQIQVDEGIKVDQNKNIFGKYANI